MSLNEYLEAKIIFSGHTHPAPVHIRLCKQTLMPKQAKGSAFDTAIITVL